MAKQTEYTLVASAGAIYKILTISIRYSPNRLRKAALKYCESNGSIDSFSANHDLPYSCIAIQEMNLYSRFPKIYWQTACLTVNASANEDNEDNKSTNYGKVAAAIGDMKSQGAVISLPDINQARFGFAPDAQNNQIIFGLKGLVGIGDDVVKQIIDRRPYSSLQDFYRKNSDVKASSLITLVKAGCFDHLEDKPRAMIMQDLLSLIAADKTEPKTSLDFKNFNAVTSLTGFVPASYRFACRVYSFRSYIFKPCFLHCNKPKSYRLDQTAQLFFENELTKFFTEGQDYYYEDDRLVVYHAKFEKQYKQIVDELSRWLKDPVTLERFNHRQRLEYAADLETKYCSGTIAKWEMDSLSFYYTEHELAWVNPSLYNITPFSSIPEEPEIVGTESRTDRKTGSTFTWDKYKLYRIAGTVLDRNNNKHTITLLTTDGVVTVKLYGGAYTHYNKQIFSIDTEGNKTVLEKSWFTRGSKLLISGIRRGDNFFPKKYADSIFNHTICLINQVLPDGSLELVLERTDSEQA